MNSSLSLSEFVLDCTLNSSQQTFTIAILGLIYMVTLSGNLLVVLVIIMNQKLQTPMFISIGTLAVIDLVTSTNLIPKMMTLLLTNFSTVPYNFCLLQMYIILHLEVLETLLLALMAVDRYIAVVHPLRYPSLVSNKVIWVVVLLFNAVGIMFITPFVMFAKELRFCHTNVLPYCFCDYSTMVRVACNEDPKYLILISTVAAILGGVPLILILFSYGRIAQVALRISSTDGKRKVFSTCLTHLLVVELFYIPLLTSYIFPGAGVQLSDEAYNTMVIVGNIVPPMMNPLIYSFRNKEIKNSIYRLFTGTRTSPDMDKH
ncbi:olfactory receptor 1M1-like [Polypterus senegalus]|nr:olfactory receptor 1M1-like [Polypterus senegalus]